MKREIEGPIDITDEIVQAAREMDKEVLLREVTEALDESLDVHAELEEPNPQVFPMWSREARLILGNQITILKALQCLLTGG